jgi:glycosyltransferase involved in cell wall biosynthesis
VDDLAMKMQELISHPEEVVRYRSIAGDYICTRYSWDDVVSETEALY